MRRLLVPAALLLAALAAAVTLLPTWSERAHRTTRARSRLEGPAGERASGAGAATPALTPTARSDGGSDPAQSRVRGVVKGPAGGLWGARVVAYREGSDEILAETHTSPDGIYSLAVEPDVPFDLAVEPIDQTALLPSRTGGIAVPPGEERQEDVNLVAGESVSGRLVDEEGSGRKGINLVAVPEGRSGEAVGRVRSGDDGVFRFRGLPPGRYQLDVADAGWMFPARVSVHAGGPDAVLVVVLALTVNLSVKDVETGGPVASFTVRVRDGDRPLLDAEGRDGAFHTRARWPGAPPRVDGQLVVPRFTLVDVAAAGYLPWGRPTSGETLAWLVPRRDPNMTVRVSFDDHEPYLGDLFATFKSKSGTGAAGGVRFERVRAGVYRGAFPLGDWDLSVTPVALFDETHIPAEAQVAAGRETELAFVLPAGGTLLFLSPPGVERTSVWIRKAPEPRQESDLTVHVSSGMGRSFLVTREGARVEGIPPGVYQIGRERVTEYEPGRFLRDTAWFREVRVDLDTVEEIALPE